MSSNPPVSVTFDLGRNGWGSVRLRVGEREILIDAVSYTTDALGDLARMALATAVGERRAACSFDGEPVESRILAERVWSPDPTPPFRVRVLDFADFYADAPDEAGQELFAEECDPNDFARAVLDAVTPSGRSGTRAGTTPTPTACSRPFARRCPLSPTEVLSRPPPRASSSPGQ